MTVKRRSIVASAGLGLVAAGALWLLFVGLPRWSAEPGPAETLPATAEAPAAAPRIKATLFYVAANGLRLVAVERDVPFGNGTVEQARRLIEEQLATAPGPYASPVPPGTELRAVFVTERGDAFVDLSRQVGDGHGGGSLSELFTVYAIVNTLTVNLPAISGVQILVEGQEVDTLAGHIDLRHPLRRSMRWVANPVRDDQDSATPSGDR